MFSPLEQFDVIRVLSISLFRSLDISLLNILLPFFVVNVLVLLLFFLFFNNLKLIPGFWQYFFEYIYVFVFDLVKQYLGKEGYAYFPFIFIIFNFIFLCNLLSLFPYGIALTSFFVLTLYLSVTIIISVFLIGLLSKGIIFLRIFIPESPMILLPLLILIELFSYFLRMFSLAMRLSANILAGHILIHTFLSFIFSLSFIKIWMVLIVLLPLFLLFLLELGVAFLQAYIFCVLLCIYLSESLSEYH